MYFHTRSTLGQNICVLALQYTPDELEPDYVQDFVFFNLHPTLYISI